MRLTEKAVNMYRGHFLSTEGEKAIAAHLKERLRDKFLKAIKMLGAITKIQEKIKKSIECFQKGLRIDNLSEELYLHLIKCHLKLGQKADALTVYKRCEKTLSESFGIGPSAETKALHFPPLKERGKDGRRGVVRGVFLKISIKNFE